jgi:hypothetical protein
MKFDGNAKSVKTNLYFYKHRATMGAKKYLTRAISGRIRSHFVTKKPF